MGTADHGLRWHILALALVLLALGLAGDVVNPWLRYDREAVAAGQLWRLVTCHLVHLNLWHAVLNLAGLLLCWIFFADLLTRRLLWCGLGAAAMLVGLGFWLLDPELGRYTGFSGLLHGLLVMCLVVGLPAHPLLHGIVMALVATRVGVEQLPGYDVDYLRDWIAGSVYVNAHFYGSLAGLAIGTVVLAARRESAIASGH